MKVNGFTSPVDLKAEQEGEFLIKGVAPEQCKGGQDIKGK
jgi:hypothetical protein